MKQSEIDARDFNGEGEGEGPVLVLREKLRGYEKMLVRSEYGDENVGWYTAGGLSEFQQQVAETAFQMGVEHGRQDGD